jgi:hypothetical protein
MSAIRILLLVLSLALVAVVARYALVGTREDPTAKVEPARQLDDVRAKVHAAESAEQQSADRADVHE